MKGITTLQMGLDKLADYRIERHKLYPLREILLLTTLSCLCGLQEWEEIVDFGEARLEWLRKYEPFANGIPSHDTVNRVVSRIDTQAFCEVFQQWVQEMMGEKVPGVVAIDGKALCGTAPKLKNGKRLLHTINAWSSELNLVIGQSVVQGKGREIEGIKALLALLNIEQDIVTIDAIGCHKEIAEQIVRQGGHYILAVKKNQKALLEEIENAFAKIKPADEHHWTDTGGGRVEERTCRVIHHLDTYIPQAQAWKKAQTVIQIQAKRYLKSEQKTTEDTRYYISDLNWQAEAFNQGIRTHWHVENKLHWTLDVTFSEDASRKRQKNAAQNFSLIRKIALNLLKNNGEKISLHRKQNKALMNTSYLERFFF